MTDIKGTGKTETVDTTNENLILRQFLSEKQEKEKVYDKLNMNRLIFCVFYHILISPMTKDELEKLVGKLRGKGRFV